MNKHLSVFIWNDKPDILNKWKKICEKSNFFNKKAIGASSDAQIKRILGKYNKRFYDVLIVDIMDTENHENKQPTGIKIIEEVRKDDPLIPIIVITKYPKNIYETQRELNIAGLFAREVMNDGNSLFDENILKPSLSLWHILHSDFSLIRRAVYGLKINIVNHANALILIKNLHRLGFTNSVESWHKHFCERITHFLGESGCDNLSKKFDVISKIFQESDPFFLAADLGRRHLAHNVQVFLIGLVIMLDKNVNTFRLSAIKSIPENKKQNDNEDLFLAILIWGCISLTHDVGYTCQDLLEIGKKLVTVSSSFKHLYPADSKIDIATWKWEQKTHGEIGMLLWESKKKNSCEDEDEDTIIDVIAEAIERHNPALGRKPDKIKLKNWASFLLFLCDELQEWNREKLDKVQENNNWQFFVCDGFDSEIIYRKDKTTGKQVESHKRFEIQLLVKDFDKNISSTSGTQSFDHLKNYLKELKEKLQNNLNAGKRLEFYLKISAINRESVSETKTIKV